MTTISAPRHAVVDSAMNLVRDTEFVGAMVATSTDAHRDTIRRLALPYFEAITKAGEDLFDAPIQRRHRTHWGYVDILAEAEILGRRVVATLSVFAPGGATTYRAYMARRELHMPLHAIVSEFMGYAPTPLLRMGEQSVYLLPHYSCPPQHRYYRFKAGWKSVGVLVSLDVRPIEAVDDVRCEWGRPKQLQVITTPSPWLATGKMEKKFLTNRINLAA